MKKLLFFLSLPLVAQGAALEFQNPVRAGNFPDPSVIRVGEEYWATATPRTGPRISPCCIHAIS